MTALMTSAFQWFSWVWKLVFQTGFFFQGNNFTVFSKFWRFFVRAFTLTLSHFRIWRQIYNNSYFWNEHHQIWLMLNNCEKSAFQERRRVHFQNYSANFDCQLAITYSNEKLAISLEALQTCNHLTKMQLLATVTIFYHIQQSKNQKVCSL